jgi:hypothetical protein
MLFVNFAPGCLRRPWTETVGYGIFVISLDHAIDPTETKGLFQGFEIGNPRPASFFYAERDTKSPFYFDYFFRTTSAIPPPTLGRTILLLQRIASVGHSKDSMGVVNENLHTSGLKPFLHGPAYTFAILRAFGSVPIFTSDQFWKFISHFRHTETPTAKITFFCIGKGNFEYLEKRVDIWIPVSFFGGPSEKPPKSAGMLGLSAIPHRWDPSTV